MWLGVIHHVVNEHEWILPYRIGSKSSCMHGPLTEEREKGWLEAGSPAHAALRDIVKDKRLLKKIPYYSNCRFVCCWFFFIRNFVYCKYVCVRVSN